MFRANISEINSVRAGQFIPSISKADSERLSFLYNGYAIETLMECLRDMKATYTSSTYTSLEDFESYADWSQPNPPWTFLPQPPPANGRTYVIPGWGVGGSKGLGSQPRDANLTEYRTFIDPISNVVGYLYSFGANLNYHELRVGDGTKYIASRSTVIPGHMSLRNLYFVAEDGTLTSMGTHNFLAFYYVQFIFTSTAVTVKVNGTTKITSSPITMTPWDINTVTQYSAGTGGFGVLDNITTTHLVKKPITHGDPHATYLGQNKGAPAYSIDLVVYS